jgi:hypothetical protein
MNTLDLLNNKPAFPAPAGVSHITEQGMTLREYAAIHLRVPDSGSEWLDEMIEQSLRDDLAAKAMQGLLANVRIGFSEDLIAIDAYKMAEEMLIRGGKA